MKRYRMILALILLVMISGCSKTYISPPNPKLQTWDVKPIDTDITYEVIDENG